MESVLNDITSLFDSVISIFFSVFSFLPSWCLDFVGTAFLFMIGVFFFKLLS